MTEPQEMARPARILPVIVLAQFAGTASWFAGNAVMGDLQKAWGLAPEAVGWVTSSVQVGFIVGTLVSAVLVLADRVSGRGLFLAAALSAAAFNAAPLVFEGLAPLLVFRFLTGVALAGIYPVGMALAASWYQKGLGRALGFLVGALVLGTALPHVLRGLGEALSWRQTLMVVSSLAVLGGGAVALWVPQGPFARRKGAFDPKALGAIFSQADFRAAAFGYFGHMWELYAFWAFVPTIVAAYGQQHVGEFNVSLWSGLVIAVGALGCVGGGLWAQRAGSARVAATLLAISGLSCLLLPLVFWAPAPVFVAFLLVWGMAVVGDSAQFSALSAQTAPPGLVGSGLTIATSLGFAVTILSIEGLSALSGVLPAQWLTVPLVLGPVAGLWSVRRLLKPAQVAAS